MDYRYACEFSVNMKFSLPVGLSYTSSVGIEFDFTNRNIRGVVYDDSLFCAIALKPVDIKIIVEKRYFILVI